LRNLSFSSPEYPRLDVFRSQDICNHKKCPVMRAEGDT
jgi:hypothetical protein